MNKYKYLLKNVSLLTLSNFGTKILSFILIPIYTNYLSTEEYGTFDIYSTTISLLIPILTINIIEAVMRYSLDKNIDKAEIFTIGIKYILGSTITFLIVCTINKAFNILSIFNQYYLYFIFIYITEVIYSLFTQFSRGLEKVKEIAISGIINSVVMLLLNILFLVKYKLGLVGYFISYIISYIIPALFLFIKLKLWKYIKLKNGKDEKIKREMLNYSKPLIFNTVGWWINNVSDRYIVTFICGVNANGIYSIAYKIPSILNIMQSILSQAWTLSAVKEIDNKESKDFYSKIYKLYNLSFILICSMLIIFDKIIAKILFSNEFYSAWKYAPFLMISVVFGALSGMLGGIFSAVKNSKIFAQTTIVGAIINTILNVVLVKMIGPIGAAIATLVAYIIVWFLRLRKANEIVDLKINVKKDIVIYVLLVLQAITLLINIQEIIVYTLETCLFAIIVFLMKDEICIIINKIIAKIRRKNEKINFRRD